MGSFLGVESYLLLEVWLMDIERFHLDWVMVNPSWLLVKTSLSSGFFWDKSISTSRNLSGPLRLFLNLKPV